MASNPYVLVENASRFVTKARLVGQSLEVHFADGAHGVLPPEVVRSTHRAAPTDVAVPTPHKVVLRFGRSSTETFPWDYLRGFCDRSYPARATANADTGRKRLGRRVRGLRHDRGLSQTDLADQARIGRVTLARIEAGVQSPSLATLDALARALGVEFADLVAGASVR
jgi:DNA-binding XRE family transcriptional regulator